jgi:hypothetical protein
VRSAHRTGGRLRTGVTNRYARTASAIVSTAAKCSIAPTNVRYLALVNWYQEMMLTSAKYRTFVGAMEHFAAVETMAEAVRA